MELEKNDFTHAIEALNIEKYRLLSLCKKAEQETEEVKSAAIKSCQDKITEIEGAIQKLTPVAIAAWHSKIHRITQIVCSVTGVEIERVRSSSRKRYVVDSRKVCVLLILRYTNSTLAHVGSYFDIDHTSIINLREKAKEHISLNDETICGIMKEAEPLVAAEFKK